MADLLALTARIAAAYAGSRRCSVSELRAVIAGTRAALEQLASPPAPKPAPAPQPVPAVSIARSVRPDRLVCLEDGLSFRSLRRHLAAAHGLTVDEYRARWDLRPDYPVVAPEYAAARSAASVEVWRERRATSAKRARSTKRTQARPSGAQRSGGKTR